MKQIILLSFIIISLVACDFGYPQFPNNNNYPNRTNPYFPDTILVDTIVNTVDYIGKIRTWTSEDWDYWEIFADTTCVRIQDLTAVCFVPIFTSSIYIQGVVGQK